MLDDPGPKSAPDPHLRMAELTVGRPVAGQSAEAVGAATLQLLLDDIVKGNLPPVVAITVHGTTCRMWQLHDIEPVDDVIRAIARREEAEAVVVVGAAPVPEGVDAHRCAAIVTECDAGGFEHRVVFKAGPEGEMFQVLGRRGDGGTPFRWLGVPPAGSVSMWVEGIVGMEGFGGRRSGGGPASS